MKNPIAYRSFHPKKSWPFILIFLLTVILLVFFLIISDEMEYDALLRTLMSVNWEDDPHLIIRENHWLPFHFMINRLGLQVYNNPLVVPRVINILFSLGTWVLLYQLWGVFFKKDILFFSLLHLTLNPSFILYSTIAMTEMRFFFLVLLSLILLRRAYMNGSFLSAAAAGMVLGLASLIRHDSWFYIPFLPFYFFFSFNKKSLHPRRHFAFLSLVFYSTAILLTSYWLIETYRYFGNPFHFLSVYVERYSDYIIRDWSVTERLAKISQAITHNLFGRSSLILAAVPFISLAISLKGRQWRYIALVSLMSLPYFFLAFANRLDFVVRYFLFSSYLLIPLVYFSAFRGKGFLRYVFPSLLLVLMLPSFKWRFVYPPRQLPETKQIGSWLLSFGNANDKIILDSYEGEWIWVVLASSLKEHTQFFIPDKYEDLGFEKLHSWFFETRPTLAIIGPCQSLYRILVEKFPEQLTPCAIVSDEVSIGQQRGVIEDQFRVHLLSPVAIPPYQIYRISYP